MRLRTVPYSLLIVSVSGLFSIISAHPDFDVHPRTIESALGQVFVKRDTLRIDNVGDEVLTWELEVQAEVNDWLSTNRESGQVNPGGNNLVIVLQDGRDLEPGHYYGNIHFTTNDPTRQTYDVPIAGHTTQYPRIEANWAIPGQGEWWGIDLDRVVGAMEWGRTYGFDLAILNRGTAALDCDTIICNNGYFTITPGDFNLDAGGNRVVRVNFVAAEVGGNAGAVSSQSSAWDPRELNFRLTATVLPVFRKGSAIPDTAIDEDAVELLLADLDTVFIVSDAGAEITVSPGAGILSRLARNNELFVRSRPNWSGNSSVVLSAVLGDSSLTDTFQVFVNPTPDPPEPFDLILPEDGTSLYYDGGDSLFVWQASNDPDDDTVLYSLAVYRQGVNDSVLFQVDSLTSPQYNLHEFYLREDLFGDFEWSVTASDGNLQRAAWSIFRLTMTEDRLSATESGLFPEKTELISLYPSPFNGHLSIVVRPTMPGLCRIELLTVDGRETEIAIEQELSLGFHQLNLHPQNLPTGFYLVRARIDGKTMLKPVNYVR